MACRSGRTIHVWDVATRTRVLYLEGHRSDGIRFAYNRAGDRIASSCWDGTLRMWDVRSGQPVFSARTAVSCLRSGPDDRMLAAGGDGDKLRLWDVTMARAYRTLARVPTTDERDYVLCAVSPSNRLLAVGMSDAVGLWDLGSGAPVAEISSPGHQCVLFDPAGALLTTGPTGVQRWPIEFDGAAPTAVRVGPPQQLPLPAAAERIALSRDGLVMASAEFAGALVWRRDQARPPIRLSDHKDTRFVAVSPDGRWVATGSHWGTKVKLWDARSGSFVQELPVETSPDVLFQPGRAIGLPPPAANVGSGPSAPGKPGHDWANAAPSHFPRTADSWQSTPAPAPSDSSIRKRVGNTLDSRTPTGTAPRA